MTVVRASGRSSHGAVGGRAVITTWATPRRASARVSEPVCSCMPPIGSNRAPRPASADAGGSNTEHSRSTRSAAHMTPEIKPGRARIKTSRHRRPAARGADGRTIAAGARPARPRPRRWPTGPRCPRPSSPLIAIESRSRRRLRHLWSSPRRPRSLISASEVSDDRSGGGRQGGPCGQTEAMTEAIGEHESDVWRLLYRVAETAATAHDLPAFYRAIHAIVGELMDATNFFIALYDDERQRISFPYYVDELDEDLPDPDLWEPFGVGNARGTAAYVMRTGEPLLLRPDDMRALVAAGEIEIIGATTWEGDWLGVPLKAGGRVVGVLVVQSYTAAVGYSEEDRDLLAYVAQHIGAALERVRALEETRQRTIELETVNSVVRALAAQLDLDALVELVGEKMRETFQADIVYVALLDRRTDRIEFPYFVERGEPVAEPAIALGEGLTGRIMETRRPLLLNSLAEVEAAVATVIGTPCSSYLGVPIMLGEEAIGVISVQSIDVEGRFASADVQLLSTLAANVGVAIHNARLYRETGRRADEMAALAELGREALAMVDPDAVIARIAERALVLLEGATSAVLQMDPGGETLGASVVVGDDAEEIRRNVFRVGEGIIGDLARRGAAEFVNDVDHDPRAQQIPGTEKEEDERLMAAPLLARETVIGMMIVWRHAGSTPFTPADLSFLISLSQQAAAAIENARLFQEAQI